jgi:hypothetical protein
VLYGVRAKSTKVSGCKSPCFFPPILLLGSGTKMDNIRIRLNECELFGDVVIPSKETARVVERYEIQVTPACTRWEAIRSNAVATILTTARWTCRGACSVVVIRKRKRRHVVEFMSLSIEQGHQSVKIHKCSLSYSYRSLTKPCQMISNVTTTDCSEIATTCR